ncbi:hypothetical protein KAH81_09635 [bacterium]|nr:hypothetical protein [bacterium]
MVIHKRTRLTPMQRQEIYDAHFKKKRRVCDLAREYHVSRPTIYKSTNARFRCLHYGIKRLEKVEAIEERLKQRSVITRTIRVK